MPDHAHLNSHHQCVALIEVYIQTKILIVFEILKFKNPAI